MNLGGSEILVVIFIALMIFGPGKLPGALRTLGRIMGEVRKYQDMAKTEIEKAVASASIDPKPKKKGNDVSDDAETDTSTVSEKPKTKPSTPDSETSVAPILDEDEL